MPQYGAITHQIDAAQLVLYTFFIFFLGLIFYLRREDKREGYPLNAERGGRVLVQGFPWIPKPKAFRLHDGRTVLRPRPEDFAGEALPNAVGTAGFVASALEPVGGNPMASGVGPAAYAQRADVPDTVWEGDPKIVPLRVDARYSIATEDDDPRGYPVIGRDGVVAGTISDVWIDRNESQIRYLEVALAPELGGGHVLAPRTLVDIQGGRRRVQAWTLLGAQLADVPKTKNPDLVTLFEEDRIMAYYGSGNLFSTPERRDPWL